LLVRRQEERPIDRPTSARDGAGRAADATSV